MTLSLIILAYVANVFLNRWLNKKIYDVYKLGATPFIWFLSLIGTAVICLAFLIEFLERSYEKLNAKNRFTNWFTGKHWK
jgi:hypothetical protein